MTLGRSLRIVAVAMITAGVLILADVAVTLVWKEPLTSLYGSVQQDNASSELKQLEQSYPSPADLRAVRGIADPRRRASILARRYKGRVKSGEGIGRIKIDRLSLDTVFVQGTGLDDLRKGPGHYPETRMPGQAHTVAIAGHRTTYLAPFHEIPDMKPGDLITLEMPYGDFTYRMTGSRIVAPTAVGIIHETGHERLVLTACHPLYSAAQRYAVFARIIGVKNVPG
jgi:sortase A